MLQKVLPRPRLPSLFQEKKSPRRESALKLEATMLLSLSDVMLCGFATGNLRVLSWDDTLAEHAIPASIGCGCVVDGYRTAWVGAGSSLYACSFGPNDRLEVREVCGATHARFVQDMVAVSNGTVWTCDVQGEIAVWDSGSEKCISRFKLRSR